MAGLRSPTPPSSRPSPMRRRERSPVKSAGERAYPYKPPSSRAKPSVESAYPYERPSSRVPRSQRIQAEDDDDGFEEEEEEEDLYGLEPSYTARSSGWPPQDRLSIEPECIELDDNPDYNIDLDVFTAYAYTSIRRAGSRRDSSISTFRELGPAGREAYMRLADRKGKGKYEGIAQLASISESMSEAMSESLPVPSQRSRRAVLAPAIPAPMTEAIEADSPSSDTYEAFYLTPLPSLTITSYADLPPPTPKRRTAHFVRRPIIIPEHTTAILISESTIKSPTTTTTTTTTTRRTTTPAAAAVSNSTTSTSISTTTTIPVAHITSHLPPGPLTPESPTSDDEGFSEPTIVETIETTSTAEALERSLFACMSQGYGHLSGRRLRGGESADAAGSSGSAGGGGVVRPRVRKRITKRKGPRRDP